MEEVIEGVHPTRMELLNVKRRLSIADKGHRLLTEKRDALLLEFMGVVKRADETSNTALASLEKAGRTLSLACAAAGSTQIRSLALASSRGVSAELRYRNLMGVTLPQITLGGVARNIDERGYGFILTHPIVDEAAREFEEATENIIELLEVENTVEALSREIKKTRRRVNALEYNILPKLRNTRKYIQMRLDELERESFYRLKTIKKRRGG